MAYKRSQMIGPSETEDNLEPSRLLLAQGGFGNAAIQDMMRSSQRQQGSLTPEEERQARSLGLNPNVVRVHVGAQGGPSGAPAWAQGTDVFFRDEEARGNPDVVAHELTHCAQASAVALSVSGVVSSSDVEEDACTGAQAILAGRPYRAVAAPSGKKYGFDATMTEAEDGTKDRNSVTHEAQTITAAEAAGYSAEDAKVLYSGNWARDFAQAGIPALEGQAKAIYSLLEILHFQEFGTELKGKMVYDAVEHMDCPSGLSGADIFGPNKDESYANWDPRYIAAQASLDQETILNSEDPLGLQVDAKGVPAYMLASRDDIKKRLREGLMNPDRSAGLRTLGEAMHTLQDLFAHSNLCEIALNVGLKEGWFGPKYQASYLDTQVHGYDEDGTVLEENLKTSSGREVMATGTFLQDDTKHSLLAKFNAQLAKNPFEVSSGPNPTAAAFLAWMQSSPQYFEKEAGMLSTALVPLARGVGTAAQGVLLGKQMLTDNQEEAALFDAQSAQLGVAMEGLQGPGGLANFYTLLVQAQEEGSSLMELLWPFMGILQEFWERVVRPCLAEAFETFVSEPLVPVAEAALDDGLAEQTGSTKISQGAKHGSKVMQEPSHTAIAKDNASEGAHTHSEGQDTHSAAWLAPLADSLSRQSSMIVLQLTKAYEMVVRAEDKVFVLELLCDVIDTLFKHPAENPEMWKSLIERHTLGNEAFMADLNAHLKNPPPSEALETPEDLSFGARLNAAWNDFGQKYGVFEKVEEAEAWLEGNLSPDALATALNEKWSEFDDEYKLLEKKDAVHQWMNENLSLDAAEAEWGGVKEGAQAQWEDAKAWVDWDGKTAGVRDWFEKNLSLDEPLGVNFKMGPVEFSLEFNPSMNSDAENNGKVSKETIEAGAKVVDEAYASIQASEKAGKDVEGAAHCWDWVNKIHGNAGVKLGSIQYQDEKYGKQIGTLDYGVLVPGTWIYYHNFNKIDSKGDHSGIFMGWEDESNKIAKVASLPLPGKKPRIRLVDFDETPITHMRHPGKAIPSTPEGEV